MNHKPGGNIPQQEGPVSQEMPEGTAKGYQTGGWKAHWIVIVTFILCVVCFMDSNVMRVVLQPMKVELGLSDAEAGFVLTVLTLSVALFAYPVSYFIDRWSRKKMLALMAIFWSIFTFTTGLSRNYAGVLFSRMFVGAGESAYSAGGTVMITAAYPPERRSRMLGIFNAAIPVGVTLGIVVGGVLSANFGWRTPFFIFAPIGIVFGLAALFLKDYKTVKQSKIAPGIGFFGSVGYLLKVKTLPWYYVGQGLMTLMSMGTAWIPALMMRQAGIKEDVASYVMGASVVFAVVGALVGGRVGDMWVKKSRRSRLILPAVLYFGCAVFQVAAVLMLMSTVQGSGVFTLGFLGFAIMGAVGTFLYYMGLPTLNAATQEVVTPDRKGIAFGAAILSMYLLGGAWSPLMVGGISDAVGGNARGLATGYMIISAGGILAAFCYYMSSRYFVQDYEKVKHMVIED
jgi:MFS family permease